MKEMIYYPVRKREILDTGYCCGLLCYILSLGPYPTAYVKVPYNNKYYGKDTDTIEIGNIVVHGGITYADDHLWISETQKIDGWFIGWDYAHFTDYMGFDEILPKECRIGGKKYTVKEIKKDVLAVCYQILKKGGYKI